MYEVGIDTHVLDELRVAGACAAAGSSQCHRPVARPFGYGRRRRQARLAGPYFMHEAGRLFVEQHDAGNRYRQLANDEVADALQQGLQAVCMQRFTRNPCKDADERVAMACALHDCLTPIPCSRRNGRAGSSNVDCRPGIGQEFVSTHTHGKPCESPAELS